MGRCLRHSRPRLPAGLPPRGGRARQHGGSSRTCRRLAGGRPLDRVAQGDASADPARRAGRRNARVHHVVHRLRADPAPRRAERVRERLDGDASPAPLPVAHRDGGGARRADLGRSRRPALHPKALSRRSGILDHLRQAGATQRDPPGPLALAGGRNGVDRLRRDHRAALRRPARDLDAAAPRPADGPGQLHLARELPSRAPPAAGPHRAVEQRMAVGRVRRASASRSHCWEPGSSSGPANGAPRRSLLRCWRRSPSPGPSSASPW